MSLHVCYRTGETEATCFERGLGPNCTSAPLVTFASEQAAAALITLGLFGEVA